MSNIEVKVEQYRTKVDLLPNGLSDNQLALELNQMSLNWDEYMKAVDYYKANKI